MPDEKKNMTLDEDALEGVTGGKVTFTKPVFDPEELPNTGPAERGQIPTGANMLRGNDCDG